MGPRAVNTGPVATGSVGTEAGHAGQAIDAPTPGEAAPGGAQTPAGDLTKGEMPPMATDNPTCGKRAVPLDLPAEQITTLRDSLTAWLGGVRSDLATPERLKDPDRTRREAQTYERLLVGLTLGQLFVPDQEAEAALREAAEGFDKENGYTEVVAEHEAMHGLLAVLKGGER